MSDICPTLRRDGDQVVILDQTRLPYEEHYLHLNSLACVATAIRDMQVRGAPLIGAAAAFVELSRSGPFTSACLAPPAGPC